MLSEWDLLEALAFLGKLDKQGASEASAGRELAHQVKSLGATHVFREDAYVDFDYSRAYREHYGSFFRPPTKSCWRLHFLKQSAEPLPELYLGYVVIWPTEPRVIGRSQILPPEPDAGFVRHVISPETVVHIGAESYTIAAPTFATKDFGVAACATVASWLATEICHSMWSLPRSTTAEITLRATDGHADHGRPLPQRYGLTTAGICSALQSLGYAPFVYDPNFGRGFNVAATLFSYLGSDVPVILMINMTETQDRHAILAIGFDVDEAELASGSRIVSAVKRFLVHDDRYGPYLTVRVGPGVGNPMIEIDYPGDIPGKPKLVHAEILHMIVPLGRSIHVISEEAHNWGRVALQQMSAIHGLTTNPTEAIPWNIRTRLISSSRLKTDSLQWTYDYAAEHLQDSDFPLRVWVTEAFEPPYEWNKEAVARVVMDPTVLRDARYTQYLWAHYGQILHDYRLDPNEEFDLQM